ncbi:MAG: DUF4852 domain-containing protein [Alphaproteobacteria bacterium]|nr:DUF4852 domain-containing protein [Alphaproteobacteria bacterium]
MKYIYRIIIVSLCLITFSAQGFAQEASEATPIAEDNEATIIEQAKEESYQFGSVENFSKLFWKIGALDVNNNEAVDNFLLINECDIYKSFYEDDFQWPEIRDAAAKMLAQEKKGFSDKFQFMIPIDLGRYDANRGGFPLVSDTGVLNLRRVQLGSNAFMQPICGVAGNIPYHPRNIILVLNRPLTFNFLELDEHVAQAYIVRQKYSKANMEEADRQLDYKRLAFLQLNVSISHFQGLEKSPGASGEQFAVVYGKVDALDVFADRKKSHLLKSLKFKQRKRDLSKQETLE